MVGQPSAINGTPESASWSPLAVGAALGLLIPMAWFWMKVAAKRVMKDRRRPVTVRRRAMYLRRILVALSKPKKHDRRKDDDKKKDDAEGEDDGDRIGRWMMSLAALRPRKT